MSDESREHKEEIERLENWVDDLQANMYINCVYCGHRYGPEDEVPATMADILKRHISICPKHPMSRLKDVLRILVNLKDSKDKFGKTPEYLRQRDYAWQEAREALKDCETKQPTSE